jgi:hypothetical protein
MEKSVAYCKAAIPSLVGKREIWERYFDLEAAEMPYSVVIASFSGFK